MVRLSNFGKNCEEGHCKHFKDVALQRLAVNAFGVRNDCFAPDFSDDIFLLTVALVQHVKDVQGEQVLVVFTRKLPFKSVQQNFGFLGTGCLLKSFNEVL